MLLLSLLSLFIFQILGVMLPGPDFFMVLRSSLKYGRNPALVVALGIACGVFIYASVVVLFLDYMSESFLSIVQWIGLFGGCYLLYIAYHCFKASGSPTSLDDKGNSVQVSKKHLFTTGLGCNLSNPKVIIFFLSLLPLFVMKSSALWYHLAIIAIMFLTTLIWFSFVASVMGYARVRSMFARQMPKLEKIFGVILILFALALFYEFYLHMVSK
ncbi:LysE family translocator [Fangia hongkongensis]|uniref:LysE family translocator n=1 Tax=Fangia hongkongensis TaxID=270495 RepID=UPI00037DDEB1|nr:LysE family translocator [Fangia hongkongensis]MBK2126059.1 LysE family translocator [Fangia hongkongensis]